MVAPLGSSSIPAPAYSFYLRDKTTLERLARFQWISHATWARRLYAAGGGELRVNDTVIDSDVLVDASYMPQEHLLEIVRDGQVEFLGIIDEVTYESETGDWSCRFIDALDWWLGSREVWPATDTASDDQEDQKAETAILHYVSGHLLASGRDVDSDLSGITFNLTVDGAAGDDVTAYARYENLAVLCRRLAQDGNVTLNLSISESGYVLDVAAPTDRTAGETDAMVFSTGRRTAMRVTPTASRRGAINVLRGLGPEEDAHRARVDWEDTADLAIRPRREGSANLTHAAISPALSPGPDNVSDGDTVTIGGTTYTFDDPANFPLTTVNLVRIGADADESLEFLAAAINDSGSVSGELYGSNTDAHPAVRARVDGRRLVITPITDAGTLTLSTTATDWAWDTASFDLSAFEMAGRAELALRSGTQYSVQVQPDPGNAPYREAWDLGDLVTVLLPPIDYALDQQIVEVAVTLDAAQVEAVQVVIGALPSDLLDDVSRLDRDVRQVTRR